MASLRLLSASQSVPCNRPRRCMSRLASPPPRGATTVTYHSMHQHRLACKGMVLCSAVSSPLDYSKRFTLHPLADLFIPTNSISLGSIQPCRNYCGNTVKLRLLTRSERHVLVGQICLTSFHDICNRSRKVCTCSDQITRLSLQTETTFQVSPMWTGATCPEVSRIVRSKHVVWTLP